MLDTNANLSIFELEALDTFLKDYINRDNLSIYEGAIVRHLFLAHINIEKQIENWKKQYAPTE